jgi:S-adenosylmethionine hydrolase
VEAQGHWFLAPDNGLLAPILVRHPDAAIVRLEVSRLGALGISQPSATFHGRDIFAPVAAELAAGRVRMADLGEPVQGLIPAWVDEPAVEASGVSGVVITMDHFGNLITNIDGKLIEGYANPQIKAGNHLFPLRRTYGDAQPGDYLALINSFGVLEIARAEQSAAEGLGLSRGAPVTVRDAARTPPAAGR